MREIEGERWREGERECVRERDREKERERARAGERECGRDGGGGRERERDREIERERKIESKGKRQRKILICQRDLQESLRVFPQHLCIASCVGTDT